MILERALDLFAVQGYDDTTMSDIARAAGVVRQTVLNHFPRKQEFIEAWGARRRLGVADFPSDPTLPVRDRIAQLFLKLADRNEREESLTRALEPHFSAVVPVRRVPDLLVDLVREGQNTGTLRRDQSPDTIAEVFFAIYFDTLSRWLHGPSGEQLAPMLLTRIDLLLVGLEVSDADAVR